MTEYETKDTGNHSTYASGMKRDSQEGKARWDLLIPLDVPYEEQLLTRCANLMERACRSKYPERNWEQANSADEMARMKSSAYRHFMQWFCGVEDGEDHAAGTFFNMLAHETTNYKVRRAEPVIHVAAPTTVSVKEIFEHFGRSGFSA